MNLRNQQSGDVLLFQEDDGGTIDIESGLVLMTCGFETAAYLSMFGGDDEDDGTSDSAVQYWGNLLTTEPSEQYRSETAFLLQTLPLTSANLLRLQDAAERDLQWFLDDSIASEVTVVVTATELNRVNFDITIAAIGEQSNFTFTQNWECIAK